jgi:hypothetical protein
VRPRRGGSHPLRPIAVDEPIAEYLAHQRALGRSYLHVEHILRRLRRFLALAGATDLDQSSFAGWCRSQRRLAANTRRGRQLVVRKFRLFRRRSEPICFVPDPLYFVRPQPYRLPVLVAPQQIAQVLSLASDMAPTRALELDGDGTAEVWSTLTSFCPSRQNRSTDASVHPRLSTALVVPIGPLSP